MNNNNHHHPPPPRGGEICVFLGILSEAFILSTKKQRNKQNVMMMKCTGTFFQRTSENCCHLNLSLIHVSIISLNMREREREACIGRRRISETPN